MNPSKPKKPKQSDGTYIKIIQEAKQEKKKKSRIAVSKKVKF